MADKTGLFKQVQSGWDPIELEHRILKWWDQSEAFEKLRAKNAGHEPWSFLDGPITANNPMGVHHAWGRTLKDCYQRYHAMLGRDQRYQNGFDCQGLWVEVEVEKEMGYETKADIERAGLEEFTNRCKARVEKYSKIQTDQSIRLGYWMDWENSYFTMSDENNYTIWAFLKKCHERGLIYKGLDAMPWCPRCETGISEQEKREGYRNVVDTAVFVRLPIVGRDGEYLLIWTTTPWTLAANVACAVNPKLRYARVRQDDHLYYVAAELVGVMKEKGKFQVEGEILGSEMVGWEYEGPFDDFENVREVFGEVSYRHRVIEWDEISENEGTGIVHIAPGCGKEDFELGKLHKLPVLMPIDEAGVYAEGFGGLSGQGAGEVVDWVLQSLRENGFYYKKEKYAHDYPHCWRCQTALLFRAVDEWYIEMSWREEIKEIVKQIRWIPSWGEDQEMNWLENMHDWMISKKRFWGLALPIFECACENFDVIGSKEELQERAVEGWEEFEGHSPHRPWVDAVRIKCEKCGELMSRIPEVGNPWLDAGIVPYSTVKYSTDREYWEKWMPADLVLECFPGQFRNWFYALLSMSTMMENRIPFKTILGHALVKDEQGREMHKSHGNTIWFDEAVEKMGADVMRWLYCGQNPTQNLNFGYQLGEQVRRRVFGTWWNVYSFFVNYARLDGFDPRSEPVDPDALQVIDRWILSKLQELVKAGNRALSEFDVSALIQKADGFIERLSNWYVRRNRRRYWRPKNSSDADKLAAYQTLYKVLTELCKILAPVAPFVCEEMYQNLVRNYDTDAPESVHHCDYPQFDEAIYDAEISKEMDMVADVVSRALGIREKKQIRVRQPLGRLLIYAQQGEAEILKKYEDQILDELNVKQLEYPQTLDGLMQYEVSLNRKTLGPKYGKEMKRIAELLAKKSAKEIAAKLDKDREIILESGSDRWILGTDDILLEKCYEQDIEASDEAEPKLFLDIKITEPLRREGLARDMVRHIQQLRKESGLEIQDRIRVNWHSQDEALCAAVGEHESYIRTETLCDEMTLLDSFDENQTKGIKMGETDCQL
ncbi:MAG: isoleucine--tRNA ligase, partial [Planctomycetes bacterium]|nr:isoleucine--tRNA ligase [Planctomycetota bacterium]